jgi:hypothetical protein
MQQVTAVTVRRAEMEPASTVAVMESTSVPPEVAAMVRRFYMGLTAGMPVDAQVACGILLMKIKRGKLPAALWSQLGLDKLAAGSHLSL